MLSWTYPCLQVRLTYCFIANFVKVISVLKRSRCALLFLRNSLLKIERKSRVWLVAYLQASNILLFNNIIWNVFFFKRISSCDEENEIYIRNFFEKNLVLFYTCHRSWSWNTSKGSINRNFKKFFDENLKCATNIGCNKSGIFFCFKCFLLFFAC